jgi:spore coat polysaccharide biosynthesis protein SpsF
MKKVVAIIQARMASSRLPGKVLLHINDQPMLEWVIRRTSRAACVNEVVVATTIDESDDQIVDFCREKKFLVSRGSGHDVLDRYYQTATSLNAGVIVRITADCPFIDPNLIDKGVDLLFRGAGVNSSHGFDFVANRLPPPWGRTYPIGLDLEVFTFELLEEAWRFASAVHQREHVTPYFYDETPAEDLRYPGSITNFTTSLTPKGHTIALMHHSPDYGNFRWTVDNPEDLNLVRTIASNFKKDSFTWKEVLGLVQMKPELNQINAHIQHKSHLDVDDRS